MIVEQLVTKQQLEIERYKSILENNELIINDLHGLIHGIGQPLNDNCLEFNNKQLKWVQGVLDLVESLNIDYRGDEEEN